MKLFIVYYIHNILNGGDEENRTPDPLLARQVLSQLSYAPMYGYVLKCLESLCRSLKTEQ